MRHFGGLMGLFLGALEQNHALMSYGYNEYRISRIWMRQLFASAGQIVIFPWIPLWPWAHRAGPNICGLPLLSNLIWNFWVVGFRWATPPATNKQLQTTSLADVTPVWYLFDSNVRTIEWFSLFIIKTALDRNRRVVLLTHVFSFFLQVPFSLPTYSKPKKIEHY